MAMKIPSLDSSGTKSSSVIKTHSFNVVCSALLVLLALWLPIDLMAAVNPNAYVSNNTTGTVTVLPSAEPICSVCGILTRPPTWILTVVAALAVLLTASTAV